MTPNDTTAVGQFEGATTKINDSPFHSHVASVIANSFYGSGNSGCHRDISFRVGDDSGEIETERDKAHLEGMFISSLGIAFLPESQSAQLHVNEKKRIKREGERKNVRFTLLLYIIR